MVPGGSFVCVTHQSQSVVNQRILAFDKFSPADRGIFHLAV